MKPLSDRHGSYLVKKLSDRHNSRCSLVAYLSPVVCLNPPRRYPDSGGPGKFLLKTGKLGYHRGASWIKSAFPKVSGTERTRVFGV